MAFDARYQRLNRVNVHGTKCSPNRSPLPPSCAPVSETLCPLDPLREPPLLLPRIHKDLHARTTAFATAARRRSREIQMHSLPRSRTVQTARCKILQPDPCAWPRSHAHSSKRVTASSFDDPGWENLARKRRRRGEDFTLRSRRRLLSRSRFPWPRQRTSSASMEEGKPLASQCNCSGRSAVKKRETGKFPL